MAIARARLSAVGLPCVTLLSADVHEQVTCHAIPFCIVSGKLYCFLMPYVVRPKARLPAVGPVSVPTAVAQ